MYNLIVAIYISEWGVCEDIGIFEKIHKSIYNKPLKYTGIIDSLKKQIYEQKVLSDISGYDLNSYTVNNITYLDIILNINEEDSLPNADGLFQLFNPYIYDGSKFINKQELNSNNKYIYITVDHPDNLEQFKTPNNSLSDDFQVLSKNYLHHEKGAGSFFIAFLIGVGSSATWDAIKSKINNSIFHYEKLDNDEIDINLIIKKVSKLSKVNSHDLNLVSFHKVDEFYHIHFKSRYKSVTIIVNKNNQILEINIIDESYL